MILGTSVVLAVLALGDAASSYRSADLQNFIVDWHNEKRRLVAKGDVPGHPPAANMKTIRWSEPIAAKARAWAEACDYKHEGEFHCGTGSYHALGENIAIHTTSKTLGRLNSTDLSDMVQWALDFMFDEHRHWTYGPYPSKCKKGICGHYTQIAWAETEAVGCGLVECRKVKNFRRAKGRPTLYLVCKYGPAGNVPGVLPYNGGRACSGCPVESRRCEDGLCGHPSSRVHLHATAGVGGKRRGWRCADGAGTCGAGDWRQGIIPGFCWDCEQWKRQGNCDPCKSSYKWARLHCAKTCDLCEFDYSLNNNSTVSGGR